jgi:hypothetical protein
MNWDVLTKYFTRPAGPATARFTLPPLVLEIESGFVTGARLEISSRRARRVKRLALRRFAVSALEPHHGRANIAEPEPLRQAVQGVTELVGTGAGGFGLVVPDAAVRVAVLDFEALPEDPRETEALILWRMKEKLSFAAEEARISFQILSREKQRVEVLAVAARRAVLAEYEAALEPLNGGAALILPASVSLLPLLPEAERGAQLLVHLCAGWVTTVVMVDGRVMLWRTRGLNAAGAGDVSREVAAEAARSLASARDRSSIELARVWLCVRPPADLGSSAEIAQAIGHPVEALPIPHTLAAGLPSPEKDILESFGQPLAGLLMNAG